MNWEYSSSIQKIGCIGFPKLSIFFSAFANSEMNAAEPSAPSKLGLIIGFSSISFGIELEIILAAVVFAAPDGASIKVQVFK